MLENGNEIEMHQIAARRRWLRNTALGFGGLAFHAMLQGLSAQEGHRIAHPLAPREPHFPARAKRIVFMFMKGGPSHVDTFDPKPLLQRDDGKPPPFELPRVVFAAQGNLLKSPW